MQLTLNIYNPQTKEVAKTYTTETVDIMFGTVEDLIDIIDMEKLDDTKELAKVILVAMKKVKPLLKEVFDGLTDEDLKNTKIKELVPLFMNIVRYAMSEINGLGDGSKN